jgi:hypothetical protein
MKTVNSERGEARLSSLLWLVVLVAAGVFAWEAVPTRMRVAQLEDFIVETTKRARFNNGEQLAQGILGKAQELRLPLDKQHLKVQLGGGRILIEAEYTVPVDFPFYTWNWHHKHSVDRPVFYF